MSVNNISVCFLCSFWVCSVSDVEAGSAWGRSRPLTDKNRRHGVWFGSALSEGGSGRYCSILNIFNCLIKSNIASLKNKLNGI